MKYINYIIELIINFLKSLFAKLFGLYKANKDKKDSLKDMEFIGFRPVFIIESYEKSWEFLKNIKDHVLKLFSEKDRDKVVKLGKKLFAAGLEYRHERSGKIILEEFEHNKTIQKSKERKR